MHFHEMLCWGVKLKFVKLFQFLCGSDSFMSHEDLHVPVAFQVKHAKYLTLSSQMNTCCYSLSVRIYILAWPS